jgi:uncharacterized protein
MSRLLPDDSARTVAVACGLGAASSSCSYAAVALARSMFRKGANFTLQWPFSSLPPISLSNSVSCWPPRIVEAARQPADKGIYGHVYSRRKHLAKDVFEQWEDCDQPFLRDGLGDDLDRSWRRTTHCRSACSLGAAALLASILFTRTPDSVEALRTFLGPIVAIVSFVYSIGSVPLAVVLWNGGISFSGVIAFIFADRIVLPILDEAYDSPFLFFGFLECSLISAHCRAAGSNLRRLADVHAEPFIWSRSRNRPSVRSSPLLRRQRHGSVESKSPHLEIPPQCS